MRTTIVEVWKQGTGTHLYLKEKSIFLSDFVVVSLDSVQNCLHAGYIHVMKCVMPNVHRAQRRANRNVYAEIKRRNVIAVIWCGHAKRHAINCLNVDGIDAKLSAIVTIVALVLPVYCDRARAAKR